MSSCIYVVVARDEEIGDTEMSYHDDKDFADKQLPLRRIANPALTYFVREKKIFGLNPED